MIASSVDGESKTTLATNLALSLATFYRDWPAYTAQQPVYLGQSVEQALHARSYYADEEGRDVNLRYHCTGGGVVMNQRLVAALQPHLHDGQADVAKAGHLGVDIGAAQPLRILDVVDQCRCRLRSQRFQEFHQRADLVFICIKFGDRRPKRAPYCARRKNGGGTAPIIYQRGL